MIAVLVLVTAPCSREYAPGESFVYAPGNRYHLPGETAVDFVKRGVASVVKVERYKLDNGAKVSDSDVALLEAALDDAAAPPVDDAVINNEPTPEA